MNRTETESLTTPASQGKPTKGIPTVLKGMIRTGMYEDFLQEELKACRTEAEREVVCSALQSAKARMRHLQNRLKRLLESEPFRSPGSVSIVPEKQAKTFSGNLLQLPA